MTFLMMMTMNELPLVLVLTSILDKVQHLKLKTFLRDYNSSDQPLKGLMAVSKTIRAILTLDQAHTMF
jgi:hypothetical protein